MGSWFADESKVKRAKNRENSSEILRENGFEFESKNDGAHLIVTFKSRIADFWPGTGKYSLRGSGKYHRGVFNLMYALKRGSAK